MLQPRSRSLTVQVPTDAVLWDAVIVLDTRPTAPNTITTRRFVIYAERPSFQGKLCEVVNGAFVHLADLPGPKEGSAKMLVEKGKLIVYYSGRADGDPTGPFQIWEHEFDVLGIQPIDWTAAARLRNVANLLKTYVPSIPVDRIDPYCK
jgi:hypothetical protein